MSPFDEAFLNFKYQAHIAEAAEQLRKKKNRERQAAWRAKKRAEKARAAVKAEWFGQAHMAAQAGQTDTTEQLAADPQALASLLMDAISRKLNHKNGRAIALAKTKLDECLLWLEAANKG